MIVCVFECVCACVGVCRFQKGDCMRSHYTHTLAERPESARGARTASETRVCRDTLHTLVRGLCARNSSRETPTSRRLSPSARQRETQTVRPLRHTHTPDARERRAAHRARSPSLARRVRARAGVRVDRMLGGRSAAWRRTRRRGGTRRRRLDVGGPGGMSEAERLPRDPRGLRSFKFPGRE